MTYSAGDKVVIIRPRPGFTPSIHTLSQVLEVTFISRYYDSLQASYVMDDGDSSTLKLFYDEIVPCIWT